MYIYVYICIYLSYPDYKKNCPPVGTGYSGLRHEKVMKMPLFYACIEAHGA